MTKAEFIVKVAKKSGLSQKDSNEVIQAALETLSELLKERDSISFIGFGSFSTVEKAARDVRIPSSGKIVSVPAKVAVKFKVGKALKESVE
ncbi:MAG: HU family DNA-binding protein [Campylobacterota bacterium]|nr:HU family DNA-binding protein [Campylobacterota bacterium]